MKGILVLGTSSGAGKTTFCAMLCRHFARKGMDPVPFKGLNLSLNSYATRDGGEIGRASSRWLLLGLPRMRPLKLEALPVELPDNSALPDYFELEEKLPPRALPAELEVPVRYSMEDVNGHLNNAEYAGLVQDFAAAKRGSSPRFRTVELHFLSAVRSPDVLAVGGGFDGDTLFVEGTGRNGVASFTALATF